MKKIVLVASVTAALLAALAGCLNVMGHIVAKEMGFTLRCLDIHLDGDLDPAELAAVVSSVLGEARRPAPGGGALTAGVDAAYRATVRLWREVSDAERRHGLPEGPEPDPVAMRAIWRAALLPSLPAQTRVA